MKNIYLGVSIIRRAWAATFDLYSSLHVSGSAGTEPSNWITMKFFDIHRPSDPD
jgi:hypothetical protein